MSTDSEGDWPRLDRITEIRSSIVPRVQNTYNSANRWNSTTCDRAAAHPKRKLEMYWASRGSNWDPQNFCNKIYKYKFNIFTGKDGFKQTHHEIILLDAVRVLADQFEGRCHQGHLVLGKDRTLFRKLCAGVAHG